MHAKSTCLQKSRGRTEKNADVFFPRSTIPLPKQSQAQIVLDRMRTMQPHSPLRPCNQQIRSALEGFSEHREKMQSTAAKHLLTQPFPEGFEAHNGNFVARQ